MNKALADHTIGFFKLTKMKSKNVIKSGTKVFTVENIETGWYGFSQYLSQVGLAMLGVNPKSAYESALARLCEVSTGDANSKFRAYEDTYEFVKENLGAAGIILDELGRVDLDKSRNPIDSLYLLADKYNREAKLNDWPPVSPMLIDRVMNIIKFKTPKDAINNIAEEYKFIPNSYSNSFETLCKLLVPTAEAGTIKLHCEALKHYIWQIKRKMIGLEVLDPLMIYISGNQGVGKSSIIRKINQEVLGEFYLEQDVADMLDSRSMESKQNYYSVLADEIQYCNDDTVSKIKKLLTATSESARVLGTNAVMKVKNNTTWAATSNHTLMSTIYDETGLRRFWEVQSTIPAGEVIDWDELNKIDIKELWTTVDENLEGGYYNRNRPLWDEMREHQNKSVAKSHAHAFLYTKSFLTSDSDTYTWCKGSDIFKLYTEWAKDSNIKSKGQSRLWFDKKLSQIGITHKEFNREKYFYVNGANSAVHIEDGEPSATTVTIKSTNDSELKEIITNNFSKTGDVRKYEVQ